jgi:hypothetical protein
MPQDNHWPARLLRCQSGGTISLSQQSTPGQVDYTGVLSSMTRPISVIEDADPASEMASLIEAARLGHPVNKGQLTALVAMQERLQSRISFLAELHTIHRISSKKYLEELDRALHEASIAGQKILGSDDFYRVFGELRADQIIDIEAFQRQNEG